MKERFDGLLLSTGIDGIYDLIEALEKGGFYTAPASSSHHLCHEGGLLEHSLNVLDTAFELINRSNEAYVLTNEENDNSFYKEVTTEDLIIACLLHDVGKMGAFGQPNYIPNVLKSGNVSTAKPWMTNNLGLQHQDISLMTVSKYIDLTEEQAKAIKYHNGLYTADGRDIKGKETPLYLIIHFADMWASRVMEG